MLYSVFHFNPFNRTNCGIETVDKGRSKNAIAAFNRTNYGIETATSNIFIDLQVLLLIAPIVELKRKNEFQKRGFNKLLIAPIMELKHIKYVAKTAKDQDAVSIACVSLKNKEGCVDLNNNKIIPIKYDYISDFENHMAIIELNNKFGLISDTGKTIIPAEYKEIDVSEHENEPNDTYIYVTAKLPNEKKSKMGLYKHNENGIIKITPVKYNKINFFHDNLASVELDSKKGYINESGKEVIQLKYDYTRSFNEGTAVVGNFEDESYDMLYGLINTKGEEIVPLQYDYINDFFNG